MAKQASRKKSEKRQRTDLVAVRVSAEEKSSFKANAANENLSGGDYFRTKCCNTAALAPPEERGNALLPEQEKLLVKALGFMGREGNNINQIAHAINLAKAEGGTPRILPTLLRFQNQIEDLHRRNGELMDLLRKALHGA